MLLLGSGLKFCTFKLCLFFLMIVKQMGHLLSELLVPKTYPCYVSYFSPATVLRLVSREYLRPGRLKGTDVLFLEVLFRCASDPHLGRLISHFLCLWQQWLYNDLLSSWNLTHLFPFVLSSFSRPSFHHILIFPGWECMVFCWTIYSPHIILMRSDLARPSKYLDNVESLI